MMRVELQIDGGFAHVPGLAKPIVVDATQLSATEAAELERLCAALPDPKHASTTPQRPAIADGRRYRITIETAHDRHQIDAADPIDHPAVANLVTFLQKRGRRG